MDAPGVFVVGDAASVMQNEHPVTIESEGDQLVDLHLWRLGPGHLGAIVSVATTTQRKEQYYRAKVARFRSLSHLTIEVRHIDPAATSSAV